MIDRKILNFCVTEQVKSNFLDCYPTFTVWKLHNFSITQILRETKFGDSRSAKLAIFTHLAALNFDLCEFLHNENSEPQKWQKQQF